MQSNLSKWYACLYDQSKLQPYCRQWPRLLTVSPVSTDTLVELKYFVCLCHEHDRTTATENFMVNFRQGMIAATGAITVRNEKYGFYSVYKKLKWSSAPLQEGYH